MNYPEIRFKHPWLLIDAIYPDIKAAYETPTNELHKLDAAVIRETLDRYEKSWRPYEEKLIHGMCELIGLEFRQNIIDVYAAPFYTSFSDPLFIATKYESDRAVDVIAHEILHRLFTDNIQTPHDTMYADEWRMLFGTEHTMNTLIHIPVHAALQALFDDVLDEPQRTERDKKMYEDYPEYLAAWKYVDEVGYQKILSQLRVSYQRLADEQSEWSSIK